MNKRPRVGESRAVDVPNELLSQHTACALLQRQVSKHALDHVHTHPQRTHQLFPEPTATTPIGKYHLPSVNGPGTSFSRPEVIRRKMGVTYEMYSAITDDL